MKIIKILLTLVILLIIGILSINSWIDYKAKDYIYKSVTDTPHNKVGLLLGTSKYITRGEVNLYYAYRIDAAVALFKAGKIDFILVSGDNGSVNYDEPSTFKNDLIARGIPEHKIFLDFAGFRTLDSVVRAKEVFGLSTFTIISQQFHNERAIFLAKHYGINAIAYNAKDVDQNYGFKTQIREYLARSKALLDLILNVQPKYLGEQLRIE